MNYNQLELIDIIEEFASCNGMISSEQDLSDIFDNEVVDYIVDQYGEDDAVAISEGFNDWDGYEINPKTVEEKLQFIADCIKSEAIHPNNIKKFEGNMVALIADHLRELPSWLDIPFSNYDILELLKSWGYTFKDEKAEYRAIENYWNATANIIMQLFNKNDIKL